MEPDVMEVHKLKYLKDYVERINTNVEELVWANLQGFKQIAHVEWELQCWRDSDDVFVEMCILDGCFIFELFLKHKDSPKNPNDHDSGPFLVGVSDPLFKSLWVLDALYRDLIQPNNQLPFKVLGILYKRTGLSRKLDIEDHHDDSKFIIDLALQFLRFIAPNQKLTHISLHLKHKKTDLVGIIYDGLNWTRLWLENCHPRIDGGISKWNMAKSATELEEFGVKFKMILIENFMDIIDGAGPVIRSPFSVSNQIPARRDRDLFSCDHSDAQVSSQFLEE